jgi:hypothetical protein
MRVRPHLVASARRYLPCLAFACTRMRGDFVCVFIIAGLSTKLFTWGGGGGYGRTCATRDDEPRPVWTRLPITHK